MEHVQSTHGTWSVNTRNTVSQHTEHGQSTLGTRSVNTRNTVIQHSEQGQSTHGTRSVNTQLTVSQHREPGQSTHETVSSQHTKQSQPAHGTRSVNTWNSQRTKQSFNTRNTVSQHTKRSVNTRNTASQRYPPRDPRSVTHPPGISSFLRREVALSTVVGFVEAEHVAGGVVEEPHGVVHPVSPPPHHGHPPPLVQRVGAVALVVVEGGLVPVVPAGRVLSVCQPSYSFF